MYNVLWTKDVGLLGSMIIVTVALVVTFSTAHSGFLDAVENVKCNSQDRVSVS